MLQQKTQKRLFFQVRFWGLLTVILLVTVIAISLSSGAAAQGSGDYFTYLPYVVRMSNEPVPFGPVHSGKGTYYLEANGDGNCLFGPSPDDLMVAAMNHTDYDNAALCGAYIKATGPKGSVVVRIVDRCANCLVGQVDFSPQAFSIIENDLNQGRVDITWQLVSPILEGPIVYHFKDGSNPWWTAVQIRNHRNPITKVEYWTGSAFKEIPRLQYNYFVESSGMGHNPYTIRVTDYFGNQITDSNIPAGLDDASFSSQSQFPAPP